MFQQYFLIVKQNCDKMIRLTCISNLLSFYIICFWTAFISILFAFENLREKIWAHDLHCGENSFSMAARYPDWVDEMMGEALWWEIWFIINKPKRNVELKSVIDEVHCKREKCCASEPFTIERVLYWIIILSHTSPKDDAFVYLLGFYKSERNTFIYLLEEITQKRAFSVDLPSRFHREAFIVTGGGVIGYYTPPKKIVTFFWGGLEP